MLSIFLLPCVRAKAVTINLEPAKDNTLYQHPGGALSNGAGNHLFAGFTGVNRIVRSLLQFDIAAEVPSSATITSASLSLHASIVFNSNSSPSLDLHRVSADWGEAGSQAVGGGGGEGAGGPALAGDATWIHRFSPSQFWTNQGGDFSSDVSASQNVSAVGSYDWSSSQLASDVQDMLDETHLNFGWILTGNETSSEGVKRFDSRESTNSPVLTIEYTLPGGGFSPADFDEDGDVDATDLGTWQAAFGLGGGGDTDADTDTDGADFLVWQQEFTGPLSLQTAAVPEPTSAALALTFMAFTALNRRQSRVRS